jgi:hypothetical protein
MFTDQKSSNKRKLFDKMSHMYYLPSADSTRLKKQNRNGLRADEVKESTVAAR